MNVSSKQYQFTLKVSPWMLWLRIAGLTIAYVIVLAMVIWLLAPINENYGTSPILITILVGVLLGISLTAFNQYLFIRHYQRAMRKVLEGTTFKYTHLEFKKTTFQFKGSTHDGDYVEGVVAHLRDNTYLVVLFNQQ